MKEAIKRMREAMKKIEPYTEQDSFLGPDYYKGMLGAYKECIRIAEVRGLEMAVGELGEEVKERVKERRVKNAEDNDQ